MRPQPGEVAFHLDDVGLVSEAWERVMSMSLPLFSSLFSDQEEGGGAEQGKLRVSCCKSTVWVISFLPTGIPFGSPGAAR